MNRYLVLIISSIALLVCTVIFSYKISSELKHYREKQEEVAEVLNFEERLADPWEWSPIFNSGEEKEQLFFDLRAEADVYYDRAKFYGIFLFCIDLGFILLNFLTSLKSQERLRIRGYAMVFAAFAFLYLGLQSPFLELEFYNLDLTLEADLELFSVDQTFPGRIYYLYQNKSIIELISLLYTGGNYLVAVALFLFSIVFPILKLFSSVVIFTYPKSRRSKKAVNVVNSLGKWSMVDVFVSAIFLAYFSFTNMNVGVDTGSTTLIGTWFFMTFVVLSIASGVFLKKITKAYPEMLQT